MSPYRSPLNPQGVFTRCDVLLIQSRVEWITIIVLFLWLQVFPDLTALWSLIGRGCGNKQIHVMDKVWLQSAVLCTLCVSKLCSIWMPDTCLYFVLIAWFISSLEMQTESWSWNICFLIPGFTIYTRFVMATLCTFHWFDWEYFIVLFLFLGTFFPYQSSFSPITVPLIANIIIRRSLLQINVNTKAAKPQSVPVFQWQ